MANDFTLLTPGEFGTLYIIFRGPSIPQNVKMIKSIFLNVPLVFEDVVGDGLKFWIPAVPRIVATELKQYLKEEGKEVEIIVSFSSTRPKIVW